MRPAKPSLPPSPQVPVGDKVGLACFAIEMMATFASRFDVESDVRDSRAPGAGGRVSKDRPSGCSPPRKATSLVIPSGARLLVRCLEREGVEYVFGVPGEETLAPGGDGR